MNTELANKLFKDFPLTFFRELGSREPFGLFSFEVNDGWEPSIRKTAELLEPLFQAAKESDPEGYVDGFYRTTQLKEKFGTGRWYISGTDKMHEIVTEWEQSTEFICETCGKPGILRGHSWLYTACGDHAKEQDRDNLEIVEAAYLEKEKEK
jgi:hypothetical protein